MNINVNQLKVNDVIPIPPEPKKEVEITNNWETTSTVPLVSFICHTYNHVNFLKDALNGFLMQETDFSYEIILHDDASVDGTTEIVRSYSESYPNIIIPIIQIENQYSKGIKPISVTLPLARGKYIAFCEGDDYWTDEKKIQIQASFLEANNHISVCGHNSISMENNRYIKAHPLSQRRDFNSKELKEGAFIQTLTAMFVNKLPKIPVEQKFILNEDNFIFSQLGKLGAYKYIEEISPGVYRKHDSGIWSSLNETEKRANQLNSFYWMSQFYLRTDDNELASYYASESAIAALSGMDRFSIRNFLKINNYFFRLALKEKMPFMKIMRDKIYSK